MNVCSVYNFQGLAGSCQFLLKDAIGVIVTNKGTTITKANFVDLTAYKVLIADDGGVSAIFLPFSQRGYEITTDDIEIITANTGAKEKTSDPMPSLMAKLDISFCDYKSLQGLDGGEFDIIVVTKDNDLIGTEMSDGTISGLRAKLQTKKMVLPNPGDRNGQFPLYVFFQSMDDFQTIWVQRANFKIKELKDAVPLGINISLNTAYTGGDVVLASKLRCTETPYSAFDATSNWTVIESNADDVAVTVVSTAAGLNTLTIKKDSSGTPANLAATDYVVLQGTETDGTYYTYISNTLKVYGGA